MSIIVQYLPKYAKLCYLREWIGGWKMVFVLWGGLPGEEKDSYLSGSLDYRLRGVLFRAAGLGAEVFLFFGGL